MNQKNKVLIAGIGGASILSILLAALYLMVFTYMTELNLSEIEHGKI